MLENMVWADPDIMQGQKSGQTLQVPSSFLPENLFSYHKLIIRAFLEYIIKNTDIRALKLGLTPEIRDRLEPESRQRIEYGSIGVERKVRLYMDLTPPAPEKGKHTGKIVLDDGRVIVPCAIMTDMRQVSPDEQWQSIWRYRAIVYPDGKVEVQRPVNGRFPELQVVSGRKEPAKAVQEPKPEDSHPKQTGQAGQGTGLALGMGAGSIFGNLWDDAYYLLCVKGSLPARIFAALGGLEEILYAGIVFLA
ncbi:MAG: hypothetical protein ABH885_04825, partial [Candidatus Omnitrophota bacterium]